MGGREWEAAAGLGETPSRVGGGGPGRGPWGCPGTAFTLEAPPSPPARAGGGRWPAWAGRAVSPAGRLAGPLPGRSRTGEDVPGWSLSFRIFQKAKVEAGNVGGFLSFQTHLAKRFLSPNQSFAAAPQLRTPTPASPLRESSERTPDPPWPSRETLEVRKRN